MFWSWKSIFNGDGAPLNSRIPIYSFDGRDVLADPFWSVDLVRFVFLFFTTVVMFLHVLFFPPGLRRTFGTGLTAEVTVC